MISRDGIQALLECVLLVAHKLVDLMSERSKNFLPKMEMLARKGCLATLMLEKAENGAVAGMAHKELAERLGIHRESITAALGELRKAGIVTIQRKTIRIQQAIQGYRKQVLPVTLGSI
jgi:CRP-like cAMP-binding protein